jgi:hypothetical protein
MQLDEFFSTDGMMIDSIDDTTTCLWMDHPITCLETCLSLYAPRKDLRSIV